jgi:hypothetical protein
MHFTVSYAHSKKIHFEFPLSSNENYSSPHFLAMKNSVYIALSTKKSDMVLAEGRYTNRDEKRHSGRRGWRGNRKRKREVVPKKIWLRGGNCWPFQDGDRRCVYDKRSRVLMVIYYIALR